MNEKYYKVPFKDIKYEEETNNINAVNNSWPTKAHFLAQCK